jgi:2-haloacid dehalogenase
MAPVSNGNIALMVDIARRNDIRWDAILGAEVAGAKALGLRTAHVARPNEAPGMESEPAIPVDIAARSFDELADKLGA